MRTKLEKWQKLVQIKFIYEVEIEYDNHDNNAKIRSEIDIYILSIKFNHPGSQEERSNKLQNLIELNIKILIKY